MVSVQVMNRGGCGKPHWTSGRTAAIDVKFSYGTASCGWDRMSSHEIRYTNLGRSCVTGYDTM